MKIPMNFISARNEFNTPEKYVPQPCFRRSFEVKEGAVSAELVIGSLGYYEVHINGKNITKGEMAPYRSNPDHYVYFDRYDITGLIAEGKNVLASLLGNGIQNTVTRTWGGLRFPWRSAPALSFEITLKYADDTEEKIISDENTLCCDSPIVFNDFHFGEYYDARLEKDGWDTVGFDDSDWRRSIRRKAPKGQAKFCEVEPIRVLGEIKPVSITECDGGYIYDFGVNEAGLCRMHINGEPGQKIHTAFFETLVDGKPHFRNIRFADNAPMQENEYICAGGEAVHTPGFTYHGFRYVYVTGITPEQATPELLTYLIIHSDLEKRGSFSCDNEIVNKIQEATVRSDLSNFHYFPTDCPQREKNGWTADAALSAEQMLLNIAPEISWKEWLRNIYRSMDENGIIPGIVPTGDWGYDGYNGPCWDCVMIWLPYYAYKYRGDIEFLKDAATPILRYIDYLYGLIDERGLIESPGGMGDWAQVGRPGGRCFKTPVIVTDSIISMDIARKAAFIYEELGMPEHAEFAKVLEKRLYDGIRAHLIDLETGIVHGDTQTAQAMVLFYGLVENDEEKKKVLDYLLTHIGWEKEHMNVGVHGGRALFRVLCDNGYADLAFRMIARTDYPSYGNWIARGATTLWEFFDAEGCGKIDSLNHHFWGDVSAWFYRYLAGMDINPTARDISNVNIAPVFVEGLDHVAAEHLLPSGLLAVEWKREGGTVALNIACPACLNGKIILPEGWHLEDGTTETELRTGSFCIRKQN